MAKRKKGSGSPIIKLQKSNPQFFSTNAWGQKWYTHFDVPGRRPGPKARELLLEQIEKLKRSIKNPEDMLYEIHFEQKTSPEAKGKEPPKGKRRTKEWSAHNWGTKVGNLDFVTNLAGSKIEMPTGLTKENAGYRIRVEAVYITVYTPPGEPLEFTARAAKAIPALRPRDKFGRFVRKDGKSRAKSGSEHKKKLRDAAKKRARTNRGKFARLKKPSEK